MRKTLIVLLVIVISLVAVAPALADHDSHPDHCEGFAQHVVQHAQAGALGRDHNPGHHRGFSICVIP